MTLVCLVAYQNYFKALIHAILQWKLIKELLLPASADYSEISRAVRSFTFEQMIEAFEVAIPSKDKQKNGAVYTPKTIRDYIVLNSLKELKLTPDQILGADISCGCGAFLFSLANIIHEQTGKSIQSIIENQLYGLDINYTSVLRAKIILSLLALSKGEDKEQFAFNLIVANALEFDWKPILAVKDSVGFDLIVGNPPYVRAKHIHESSKRLLKNWQVTKSGNPDLYIPFFEIGLENLNADGVLGYITVNSFYRSVNARAVRNYLQGKQAYLKIIDFGHEQIFTGKLAYTCICFLSHARSSSVFFIKTNSVSLTDLKESEFTPIPYRSLNSHRGWLLNDSQAIRNIQKIESSGTPLGKLLPIKNGIATLSNKTYIFKPSDEDDSFYHFEKGGLSYKVEKEICRNIIKPNVLKFEHEIPKLREKIIFPYSNRKIPLAIVPEAYFRNKFPFAYHYLADHKERLAQRDKGKGDYGEWYAFGRTQALADYGLKLLFPYIAKRPYFVFTSEKDMLIYCGYAIFSESEKELLILKKLLESMVFNYYMQNTSKPYASGYYSYAKNYVKNFGVCELDEGEKEYLLELKVQEKIDRFIQDKYDIVLDA